MKKNAKFYRYQLPLKSSLVLRTEKLTVREGLLVRLEENGKVGWGEIAPLPTFSRESFDDALSQCRMWLRAWLRNEPSDLEQYAPSVAFGLSMALFELNGNLTEQYSPTAVPLYSGDMPRFREQLAHQRVAKMKIGRENAEQEGKIANQLLSEFPHLQLRFDANRAWSLEQANRFAEQITLSNRSRIQFIEEPCQTPVLSLQFASDNHIAIAWDESSREPDFQFLSSPYVRTIIIKPTLVGSVQKCLDLIQQTQRLGMQIVISSSLESSLGLTQLARLAYQFTPNSPAGLDTLSLMSHQLIRGWGSNELPIHNVGSPLITEIPF